MGSATGFAFAGVAAIMFGVQYVPVKKYEIFDGTTFQWFMCNGILMVGTCLSIATGEIQNGISLLCMMGGALWALSNYIVIPLVKLLGIGLGFSLYHFVNLVVGYCVGRFGLFGLPHMQAKGPYGQLICDCGCGLLLVGFVVMVLVENSPGTPDAEDRPLPPRIVAGADGADDMVQEYRERYRQWRLGEARGARDRVSDFVVTAAGVRQRGPVRFFNFGLYEEPSVRQSGCAPESVEIPEPPRASSEPTLLGERLLNAGSSVEGRCGAYGERVLGVLLAVVGGTLCGVNNVPPSLYTLQHKDLTPFAAVFSQCLGIWLVSSFIYLVYSSLARLVKWPVPHSVIRPAYLSGCIWAVGFACMLAGIKDLGYSIGYTLDAVGPVVVSSVISIVVYKEISGRRQLSLFAVSFFCQLTGVTLIAVFGQ